MILRPNESTPYKKQWDYLCSALNNKRLPQAMLCVGSLDVALAEFMQQLTQMIFCKKETKPCFACIDCQMIARNEHPDMEWIKPEKSNGPIKIDQIRELHNKVYITPQRSIYRLIVIESTDRMNIFAANSLLKILEEPAPHTLFLLIAQQLSTVLPTLLSRCHIMRFTGETDASQMNLLQMAERYPLESEQSILFKQAEPILDDLIAVIEKRNHPCIVAAQWSQFDLHTLLWFFYLVYAQVQMIQIKGAIHVGPALSQLNRLAFLLDPMMIFDQIDKINNLQRQLNRNININQTLALEDLLFD